MLAHAGGGELEVVPEIADAALTVSAQEIEDLLAGNLHMRLRLLAGPRSGSSLERQGYDNRSLFQCRR